MTQSDDSAISAPVKRFTNFDFSASLKLVPVICEQAGQIVHTTGVMLIYKNPQPVLEAQFHAAATYKDDDFPREIMRGSGQHFYKVGEMHDLTSLQGVIEQGHPQTTELTLAYRQLARAVYGRHAKADLYLTL